MPKERKRKHSEVDDVELKKHYDTFYEQPPPGTVQEEVERPEDSIPDMPGNEAARNFLANAPSKGLWMPLGKEVKVMKCWRCKSYGHRTGDRECPMFIIGNRDSEKFRTAHEDPMHDFVVESKRQEKQNRIDQLKLLLAESTTSEDSSSSTDSEESKSKRAKRKKHTSEKHKKHKSEKHKRKSKQKKKQKHEGSSSGEDSDHNHHRKHRSHHMHRNKSDSDDTDSSREHSKTKKKKHKDKTSEREKEYKQRKKDKN